MRIFWDLMGFIGVGWTISAVGLLLLYFACRGGAWSEDITE